MAYENQSRTIVIDGPTTAQMFQLSIQCSSMQSRINSMLTSGNTNVRKSGMEAQNIIQSAIDALREELKRAQKTVQPPKQTARSTKGAANKSVKPENNGKVVKLAEKKEPTTEPSKDSQKPEATKKKAQVKVESK